jgi:hypothetical protein
MRMKTIVKIITSVAFIILLQSCTEDIDLDIAGGEGKIVIEGNIENGKYAEVIITRNSPVSQPLDFTKILVNNAKVYVSNGATTDTLMFGIDSASSIPLVYRGNKIIGAPGQTYYLTVIADGKTYTANTVIPPLIKLDSVWWKPQPDKGDSLGFAWARFTEPTGQGNAYRWFAKRAGKDRRYLAPFGASIDDKFIDGKSFEFYAIRGNDPTDPIDENDEKARREAVYFRKNDTIHIKFCTTSNEVYRFYVTYETALQSNGNPFASPTSIISNISGGGLGVWAGLGATYDTIYPKP